MALFVFLAAFVLAAPAVHVAGQQGFLSIDCGVQAADSSRREHKTNITYVSDGLYVDGGENHLTDFDMGVNVNYTSELTLRSFPSGERNCYTLPTVSGDMYLVRMVFFYGNYDRRNTIPTFEVHLGSNYWDTYSDENKG